MRWPRLSRRRTMLTPMPTIPFSIVLSLRKWGFTPLSPTLPLRAGGGLLDRRSDRRRQRLPSGRRFFAERHPQNREPARRQRLQVAERLRLLEDREAERLAGDGHVAGVVLDDL